jgi:hypothetical protein
VTKKKKGCPPLPILRFIQRDRKGERGEREREREREKEKGI